MHTRGEFVGCPFIRAGLKEKKRRTTANSRFAASVSNQANVKDLARRFQSPQRGLGHS
jgi:hypothetical protein